MRDNWQLFSGILPISGCNHMIENFLKLPLQDATTFNGSLDARKSKIRWVTGEHGLTDHLLRFVNKANAECFNVDVQQEMNEVQFTEYESEYGGKYDWHHDVDWENPKNFDRKLSVVVQLSDTDTFSGGDFEFSEVSSPSRKEFCQGSVLIFPSYLKHRVTEVTEGKRYSLVSWVRGPRWK